MKKIEFTEAWCLASADAEDGFDIQAGAPGAVRTTCGDCFERLPCHCDAADRRVNELNPGRLVSATPLSIPRAKGERFSQPVTEIHTADDLAYLEAVQMEALAERFREIDADEEPAPTAPIPAVLSGCVDLDWHLDPEDRDVFRDVKEGLETLTKTRIAGYEVTHRVSYSPGACAVCAPEPCSCNY